MGYTPEEIAAAIAEKARREKGASTNISVYTGGNKDITPTGLDAHADYTNEQIIQAANSMGIDTTGMNNKALQSALYDKADAYTRAYMWGTAGDTNKGGTKSKHPKWAPQKKADGSFETVPEYKERMSKTYTPDQIEKETGALKGSFTDDILGKRTLGLLGLMAPTRTPAPRVDITAPEAKVNTPPGDIRAEHLADANVPEIPDDFWLQDKIKVAGAFGDMMRVKKYMPWQATYNPTLMDPTFYDPTRELAANSSAANTASQAIGMYAGPQAMNARLAQVQGNASKNAADILGRYNNQNVTVANQFEQANAGIMNQYSADRANQATNLFDKNTIVNQQFDSEKNMARQNLRQGYIDAVTNRANTQALNSMQDNYYVDPRSGGYVNFWHGRKVKPEMAADPYKQRADAYSKLKEQYPNIPDEVLSKWFTG